jgi:hypothetical protein
MSSYRFLTLASLLAAMAMPSVAKAQNRCLDVPVSIQETIDEELLDVNGTPRVTKAQAVRTRDLSRAHFVSVIMYAPGIEDGETLTWLVSGELTNPGMWLAADNVTAAFTFVPYAGDTRVGRVINADGYREARACARGAAQSNRQSLYHPLVMPGLEPTSEL